MTVMIEPDDYEMTKHIAIFVLGGSREDGPGVEFFEELPL